MNSILTTALMGFFAFSGGSTLETGAAGQALKELAQASAAQTLTVHMTGYNAVPAQTDGDPTVTASGVRSNPEVVAARSRDLAEKLPYGTVIEVIVPKEKAHTCGLSAVDHLIGYRVMADTMHKRKTNQIDIMFDTTDRVVHSGKQKNAAVVLGVCKNIEIRIVGQIDLKDIPKTQAELAAAIGEASLAFSK